MNNADSKLVQWEYSMWSWQDKSTSVPYIETLNKRGEEGWECYCVVKSDNYWNHFFKRPKR